MAGIRSEHSTTLHKLDSPFGFWRNILAFGRNLPQSELVVSSPPHADLSLGAEGTPWKHQHARDTFREFAPVTAVNAFPHSKQPQAEIIDSFSSSPIALFLDELLPSPPSPQAVRRLSVGGATRVVKGWITERYYRLVNQIPPLSWRDHLPIYVPVDSQPKREPQPNPTQRPALRLSKPENVRRLRAWQPLVITKQSTFEEQFTLAHQRPDLRLSRYVLPLQRRVISQAA